MKLPRTFSSINISLLTVNITSKTCLHTMYRCRRNNEFNHYSRKRYLVVASFGVVVSTLVLYKQVQAFDNYKPMCQHL